MEHIPVLITEVMAALPESPQTYLDCTFGRGGHLKAIKAKFPEIKMLAIDRDQAAIDYAKSKFSSWIEAKDLRLFKGNFMFLAEEWKGHAFESERFDLILADLGVSSPQLDEAERGFSFYHEGPLDMRMDQSQSFTAKAIIEEYNGDELTDLFKIYGEVRNPSRVVEAILRSRQTKPFASTRDLAELIASVEGWRKKGSHPATQYFLALRLKVNEEIDPLENAIYDLINRLNPSGRLLVITFHSMEDRIVKWAFKKREETGRIITKKVIQPKWEEKKQNPRARSAKLRVFEKLGVQNEA